MIGRIVAAACWSLLVAACGSVPTWERLPATRLALAVPPGKIAEECFALAAGEHIEYQFKASVPLDFDLHTHRGREVVTPVQVERTREQAGTFTSPQRADYCMTWRNRGAVPAHITGDWRQLR